MKIHRPGGAGERISGVEELKRRRPLWRRVLNLAILCGLILLALRYVDFSQVWELISTADWRYLLLVLALATSSRFLMAWKWRLLLQAAEVRVGYDKVLGAYYRSAVVSYVPFMVIGADLLRIHWVGSELGKRAAVAATVVMEKVLGLISALFLATLGLVVILAYQELEQGSTLLGLAVAGLLVGLLALGLSMQGGLHARALRLVQRWVPEKLANTLDGLSSAYLLAGNRRWIVAQAQLLFMVEHLVQFLMLYFAGRAIGVDLELPLFLAGISVVTLLRRVAIYIQGWGLAQAAAVLVLGFLGLSPEQSLSLSLLADAVTMVAALPGLMLLVRDALKPAGAPVRED